MKLRTHTCAAEGCQHVIPTGMLMCVEHWRMVPVATRREILVELRLGLGTDCKTYRDAVARAVAAVRGKQERKARSGSSGGLFTEV